MYPKYLIQIIISTLHQHVIGVPIGLYTKPRSPASKLCVHSEILAITQEPKDSDILPSHFLQQPRMVSCSKSQYCFWNQRAQIFRALDPRGKHGFAWKPSPLNIVNKVLGAQE